MKILIIGATGPTGKQLVAQALAAGHAVTALVRDPVRNDLPATLKKSVGNVLDRPSLERAAAGQEAVICCLGSAASGPFKRVTLLSEGTRHLIAAMKAAGVKRLVCITGIGAGDSKGHGPWYYNWLIQPLVLRGVYEDKTRQETLVRASGLEWTLVRPALLSDDAARGEGNYRVLTDLNGIAAGKIARADVAGFCVRQVADNRYLLQTPLLTN